MKSTRQLTLGSQNPYAPLKLPSPDHWIVYTDLDGTLLNHHTYDFDAVRPVLARLQELGVPVVLNSSKTLAELEVWQQKLQLETPMIAENGGVISLGKGQEDILVGQPYDSIRSFLRLCREQHHWEFEGFGDWTIAELMNETGLHANEAVLASERSVTEPIIWKDSDANLMAFQQRLAGQHMALKKGGRFYHVMGKHDKSDAMRVLARQCFADKVKPFVIALGDSENDVSMLRLADLAVVLPNASGNSLSVSNAVYSKQPAPEGWASAFEQLFLWGQS